jgi:signal transduction histidine kinase/ligand-binding sensor domain-containing protein
LSLGLRSIDLAQRCAVGWRRGIVLLAILSAFSGAAAAQHRDLTLRQLNHRAFTSEEGAPSEIRALAQTSDGTLWIGGSTGLIRFDGIRFVPYPGAAEEPLPSTNVSSLIAAPDGGLWMGFRLGGVSLLKAGRVTRYGVREGLPEGSVDALAWDRDGSLWAAARGGLAHFTGTRWEIVAAQSQVGIPFAVLVDRAGTLWVASAEGLFARLAGESRFREVGRKVRFTPGRLILAAAADGRIWAASDNGLIRVDSAANPEADGSVTIRGISGGPLAFDTRGNLWASDVNADVLLRVPFQALTREGDPGTTLEPEIFSRADGLSSGPVFAVLQDREQNIWVGTNSGLDRFGHSNVVQDVALPCSQGGFSQDRGAFAAGDAGSLWIACTAGYVTGVEEIRGGAVVSRHITPSFGVAYRDRDGTVWFGGPAALGHLEAGRIISTPMPAQAGGRRVQALVRDSHGALWVSVIGKGVFRFLDGEWSEYGKLDALPRDPAYVETLDDAGALWFGYTGNRIARVTGNAVRVFDTTQGLEVGNVMAILAHEGALWVGGELGFARFDGARFVPIHSTAGALFRGVSGIVRARNGDFWLNGIRGIVRIDRREIERVVREPAHRVEVETFDYLDGVPGTAVQFRPQPSAVETTDGRIWFAMTAGIVYIDAMHLVRNTLAPPVTIWSVSSGPERYPNLGPALRLPVQTSRLQIEYSAGSLTVPERVHFRYKLEGSDRDWLDVGTRREALYTNLGPGRYTFRVTAANNDGVWNDTGASIGFTIPPAFYQTTWFYALCALVFVAILAGLYRVRVRQVAAQVRGRLEARLAERERIARDLHDTLLQGMQGLIWRFQAAADRIPPGEPSRQLMEQSLDRADQLLAESRDKVKDLRPAATDVADLPRALAAAGEQWGEQHPAKFRVSVQGTARELHPIVREEAFLIGREALGNAFRHAGAGDIEVEVTYGERALHVRVRDDGQGINPAVLDAGGRPGHFGLIGMRERAKKLGAHLEVWSKPGAGTEIDLRVPAEVAYRYSPTASGRLRSQRALSRGSSALEH